MLLEQARSSVVAVVIVVAVDYYYYYHHHHHHPHHHYFTTAATTTIPSLEQNICAWAVAGAVLSSPLAVRVRQARGALDPSTANEALATALAARGAWELAVTKGGQARPSMVGPFRRQTWVWG